MIHLIIINIFAFIIGYIAGCTIENDHWVRAVEAVDRDVCQTQYPVGVFYDQTLNRGREICGDSIRSVFIRGNWVEWP